MRIALLVVVILALFGFASLLDIVFKPNPKPEEIVKTTKIDSVWRVVEFEGRRYLMYSNTNQCALVALPPEPNDFEQVAPGHWIRKK